ncbi:MAG: peptidyl-prolyl cis-trans isomerase [Candidatus Sumerlaeia bacterium]|nr:peptidyl-prolyl cis-trans isomerase [Candidatus Sumerlaeia bacterium]
MKLLFPPALVTLLTGCALWRSEPPEPEPLPVPIPSPRLPDTASPESVSRELTRDVAFTIGGRDYSSDFVLLQQRAHEAEAAERGETPLAPAEFREQLIDEMVLLAAAESAPGADAPVFAAQLEAARRRMIIEHFLAEGLFRNLSVSSAEIEAHYRSHLSRYTEPEQIRIRQLVFDSREAAEAAAAQLEGGEDFGALAQSLGLTPVDSGWVSRGQMVEEIERVAFATPVGSVSGVITTDDAHVILAKMGSIPAQVRPLAEVEGEIRQELLEQRRERLLREFLAAQRQAQGLAP